ncbi:SAP domain-containing protein, partial [Fusobacterium ulcerans]
QQGTVKELKEILKNAGLVQTGNKEMLIQRVTENIGEDELKKYFGNDKYKLTPLGRKFLKDNIEELEEVLAGNGEKGNKEAVEEILVEEKIEETPIEAVEKVEVEEEIIEEAPTEIIKETEIKEETVKGTEEIKVEVKEKTEEKAIKEEKIVEHKDKFANNYIIAGIIIIVAVVCINMFL